MTDFSQEIDFWKQEIYNNLDYYKQRNNGTISSPELLLEIHAQLSSKHNKMKILDLGCGPLSLLSRKDFQNQELFFFDPLNHVYEEILLNNSIIREGNYRKVSAEELSKFKYIKKFNLIFARNSLDHSEDLIKSIKSIKRSLTDDGAALIEIFENEGEHAGYMGLHKWNIQKIGNDLILWYPGIYVSLNKLLNRKSYFLNCYEVVKYHAEFQKEVKLLEVILIKSSFKNRFEIENKHIKIMYSPIGAVRIKLKSNIFQLPYFAHLYFDDATTEEKSFQHFKDRKWRNLMYNFSEKKLTKLVVGQFNTEYDSQGKEIYSNAWELQLDISQLINSI